MIQLTRQNGHSPTVCDSAAFSTFTGLCSQHSRPVLEHSVMAAGSPVPINSLPGPPTPQPPARLLSVAEDEAGHSTEGGPHRDPW